MTSFKRGVHPRGCKELAKSESITPLAKLGKPQTVYIPLNQFANEKCEIMVNEGDEVKKGTIIAKATGKFGVDVHSSVCGKVTGFKELRTATNVRVNHVVIENSFENEVEKLKPIGERNKAALLARIKEAGIIGMGGAAFPTHFKLAVPPDKTVDTLIINGAECEPYINCDNRLMIEQAEKVISGAVIIAEILGVTRIVIGVEDNKKEAIDSLLKVSNTTDNLKELGSKTVILPLKTKYPQGAEKMIIYAATKREVPTGKLPADVNCVVSNLHTAYAVHNTVEENLPLFERVVTVSGKGVEKPMNLLVPIGTLYEDLYEVSGGKDEEVYEIISGGVMMGFSQIDSKVAVTKSTSSVLYLKKEEVKTDLASVCINCGACAAHCPLKLMPMYIDGYTLDGNFEKAKEYGAMKCMECGSCAFGCPAKRPLVQSIRLAKKMIRARGI